MPRKPAKKSYSIPYRKTYKKKTKYTKSKNVSPFINSIARSVGKVVGDMILPGVGGNIGSAVADIGHRTFKTVTGHGDYEIKSNSLLDASKDQIPVFSNNVRSTRIRHREYLDDVVSGPAGSFHIQKYIINPALSETFPWLSRVANNYEEYRIHGMIFEYRTMSADALNSTNTALGQVILATRYNVLSPDFTNKQQMENYEFGVSVKPSNSCMHPIECQPSETPIPELFNRFGNVADSDLRLYDFGNFYIATNGLQAANVNLGELWVTYDIEFYKPRISDLNISQLYHNQISPVLPDYFASLTQLYTSLDVEIGTNTITFPADYFGSAAIIYTVVGAISGVTSPTITPSGNCLPISSFGGGSITNLRVGTGSNSNGCASILYVYCNGGGFVLFTGGTLPTGIVSANLSVITLPSDYR